MTYAATYLIHLLYRGKRHPWKPTILQSIISIWSKQKLETLTDYFTPRKVWQQNSTKNPKNLIADVLSGSVWKTLDNLCPSVCGSQKSLVNYFETVEFAILSQYLLYTQTKDLTRNSWFGILSS